MIDEKNLSCLLVRQFAPVAASIGCSLPTEAGFCSKDLELMAQIQQEDTFLRISGWLQQSWTPGQTVLRLDSG